MAFQNYGNPIASNHAGSVFLTRKGLQFWWVPTEFLKKNREAVEIRPHMMKEVEAVYRLIAMGKITEAQSRDARWLSRFFRKSVGLTF